MKRINNIALYQLHNAVRGLVGEHGRRLCCFCREEVPVGRLIRRASRRARLWCSDECVHDYKMLNDWSYICGQVAKRDHGICRDCGLDTQKLRTRYNKLVQWAKERNYRQQHRILFLAIKLSWLRKYNMRPPDLARQYWYDVHHVVPLKDNGSNNLQNLITLCIACQRRKIKQYRQETLSL